MIMGMPMGAVQGAAAQGTQVQRGIDRNAMMGTIGKMLATPQGQEQVIGQLAQMGPPPQVPMAPSVPNQVGPALAGMRQGMMPQAVPRVPVMPGELATNPRSIGSALGGY